MTEIYNLTDVTTSYNLMDLTTNLNELTNYYFGAIALMVLFIIIFVAFKSYGTRTALLSSSWIVTLIAGLMFIVGLISYDVLLICIILTVLIISAFMLSE